MYSLLKPCRTSAAIEAIPAERLALDVGLCEDALKQNCTIVANAGIMLVIMDLCEVSIHRDGRLILKTDSQDLATRQAARIAGWLQGSPALRKLRDNRGTGRHART